MGRDCWFLIGVLVGWACCGCAMRAPGPEGEDYAKQIVWKQQYLMGDRTPPSVEWVLPTQLNCADGNGWKPAPGTAIYDCVAGLYWNQNNYAMVAWPHESTPISQTSFAHEFCHAWSYMTTGDGDVNHLGPCFNPPTSYVNIANDALAKVDL